MFMVSSISSSSQAAQAYQPQQYQPNTQIHKNVQGDKEPEDTVVLSKQATESSDVDHDGDRH
jgi:hypothetical protein